MAYTYIVTTCDTLRESDTASDLDLWDAYHHDHNDDVPEGIVINAQRTIGIDDDTDLDDLPF